MRLTDWIRMAWARLLGRDAYVNGKGKLCWARALKSDEKGMITSDHWARILNQTRAEERDRRRP